MENNFNEYESYSSSTSSQAQEAEVNLAVMSKTFIFMSIALFISAISAFLAFQKGFLVGQNQLMTLLVVEIGLVFLASFVVEKKMVLLGGLLFLAYSCVNGITLSVIFYVFELGSIFSIFIIAALVFGVMAVYGYVTKSDLTRVGSIGMMSLFGVIILSVVNIFMRSSGLDFILSIVGLAIFIGLTAYDMQKIKEMARENVEKSTTAIAIFGALQLYLDFINIFLKLLRLFGKRK